MRLFRSAIVTRKLNAIKAWHRRRPIRYPSAYHRRFFSLVVMVVGTFLAFAGAQELRPWFWPSMAFLDAMLMYAVIVALMVFTGLSNGLGDVMGWNKLDFSKVYKKPAGHESVTNSPRDNRIMVLVFLGLFVLFVALHQLVHHLFWSETDLSTMPMIIFSLLDFWFCFGGPLVALLKRKPMTVPWPNNRRV